MRSVLETAEALLNGWREDPAGCMQQFVAPDIVYTLNVSPEVHMLGGETVGWDAVNAKMMGVREHFDYVVYRPRVLDVRDDKVRARIEFIYRHKASGELLSGYFRCVLTVRDGKVVSVDEFVDAPFLESFMRMIGQNC